MVRRRTLAYSGEFCAAVGLPPERPYVLYVCSSAFIAQDEVAFVKDWLRAMRATADPLLASAGVLVRPHPQNASQWQGVDLSSSGDVVVWPSAPSNPVDAGAKADYFDSLYHCAAVVGVNTTALIEAGIVGRPVHTVLMPRFADVQHGTLHFQHLVEQVRWPVKGRGVPRGALRAARAQHARGPD